MRIVTIGACLVFLAVSPPGWAANANNPYGNVDHRNDAGNDTGDSQVDRLNQAQLSGGDTNPSAWQRPRRSYVPAPPPDYYPPRYYPPAGYGYPPQIYPQPGYMPPPPGYPYAR